MNQSIKQSHTLLNIISSAGLILFLVLFIISAQFYPGGSTYDPNAEGFSWIHNYWCNLFHVETIKGEQNPARPLAIFGMGILCLSVAIFFYQFAFLLASQSRWKHWIWIGGIASMVSAFFMFTQYHDELTILASILACLAVIGMLSVLYNQRIKKSQGLAITCMLLLIVNNVIYYSSMGIHYLPIIQKASILLVILWLLQMNIVIKSYIN